VINSQAPSAPSLQDPEEWFHTIATHYVVAYIVFHLNSVGVLKLLDKADSVELRTLADSLKLDVRILGILLDYLVNVDTLIVQDSQGRYALSPFGRSVLARYARTGPSGREFNLFDLRLGAYHPVWAALGPLLRGEVTYGKEVRREGAHAAEALYKLASAVLPALKSIAQELDSSTLIEIGPTSGLLHELAAARPAAHYAGVDRKQEALDAASKRALAAGVTNITWKRADLFDLEDWAPPFQGCERVLFISFHFHEFLSQGMERIQAFIQELRRRFRGHHLVIFEQVRMKPELRSTVRNAQWLYAQSNILIHHLIKNAVILSEEEWIALFVDQGCRLTVSKPTDAFGFSAYVFTL